LHTGKAAKDTAGNSSITDTTQYITLFDAPYGMADNLTVLGWTTDSVAVEISYQLKNSYTGATGAVTLLNDTLISVGPITGADTSHIVGSLAVAALSGYNSARFFFNYVTGNGTTAGRKFKAFLELRQ